MTMSYDIRLKDPVTKETIVFADKRHIRGGAYEIGGTHEARLNITYNYWDRFVKAFNDEDGVRSIYGLTGAESIPILTAAIEKLSDDVSTNYWESTEGNAKKALFGLLALARMRPDGVWVGD
jgi:hypothetical protein